MKPTKALIDRLRTLMNKLLDQVSANIAAPWIVEINYVSDAILQYQILQSWFKRK